jgi:GntR family transcriptional regulator/MocR family aminotransferase
MSDSWANSGVDLLLDLAGSHRRSAVEDALRTAIRTGRLAEGTRLPSSRSLGAELGLARNTVAEAYAQLVAEGWLVARQGSGTRVAAPPALPPHRDPGRRASAANPQKHQFDLTPGRPDLSGFPRAAWLSASRRALTSAANELLDYPDPRGLLGLREALTGYLARVRGVRTTPDRIVICSGFVQALNLLAVTLSRNGASTVSMESHGLAHHREVFRAGGLQPASIGVDGSGARTDQLAGAQAVLLTPAHQFPLGVPLSPRRRSTALEWAARTGGLVIEDDYDGEFRYDRKPIGALQGLAPDRVAYVGTASKSLVPALGLAWLVLPPSLVDGVVEAKYQNDGFTGIFEQLGFEEFIRSGAYDRHVRRSRLRYRDRRDRLVAALSRPPGTAVRITGIAAGLHAVVELPGRTPADEPAICTRAARAGLTLAGLSTYRHEPDPDAAGALVIGYATPPEHAYAGALEALQNVLA